MQKQTLEVKSPKAQIREYTQKIKQFEKQIGKLSKIQELANKGRKMLGLKEKTPKATPDKTIAGLNSKVKKGGKMMETLVKNGMKSKEARKNNMGPMRRI